MRKLVGSVALVGAMAVGMTGITAQPGMAAAETRGVVQGVAVGAPRTALPVSEMGAQVAAPRQASGPAQSVGQPASMGLRVGFALPVVVGYAVWLVVRFGIPWLIRYASGVFTSVFLNQSLKLLVCRELRRINNGWGWSWYCRGT